VAATQAQDPGTRLHYLRTMNPLNLENLAVYPRRLGTNRTNPYAKPGNSALLSKGMPSFETRHCNRAVPGITNTQPSGVPLLDQLVPQQLLDNLNRFVLSQATNSQTAAPPCYAQGPYTQSGETTQYPHVKAK
jgi:phospholipid/cholesterol/gamma-HCH transport system substrate-binding protein